MPSNGMVTITRGEAWWLFRTRQGLTQADFAARCRISEEQVRAYERDRDTPPVPALGPASPPLTLGEQCRIYRRRRGWSLTRAARSLHVSRQTVWKAEHDRTSGVTAILARYRDLGAPYPDGGLSVNVRVIPAEASEKKDG